MGSSLEYGKIKETFSPDEMKVIADWIYEVTKQISRYQSELVEN